MLKVYNHVSENHTIYAHVYYLILTELAQYLVNAIHTAFVLPRRFVCKLNYFYYFWNLLYFRCGTMFWTNKQISALFSISLFLSVYVFLDSFVCYSIFTIFQSFLSYMYFSNKIIITFFVLLYVLCMCMYIETYMSSHFNLLLHVSNKFKPSLNLIHVTFSLISVLKWHQM